MGYRVEGDGVERGNEGAGWEEGTRALGEDDGDGLGDRAHQSADLLRKGITVA